MEFLILHSADGNKMALNSNYIVGIDLCHASDVGCSSKEFAVSLIISSHENIEPIAFFDSYDDANNFFQLLQLALTKSLKTFSLLCLIKECNGVGVANYYDEAD